MKRSSGSIDASVIEPGTVGVGLSELEAEIDRIVLKSSASDSIDSRARAASDDQATRLRRLMGNGDGSTAGFIGEGPEAERDLSLPPRSRTEDAPFTVAIASGKGGVGKTNVAANLSAALAARGYRVTLLDADLGTANADVLCGLSPAARLDHVLTPGGLEFHDGARRTLRDILIEAPGGFRLVPGSAGISRMADLSGREQRRLFEALTAIDHDTDVLVIDTAAGVGRTVTAFMDIADICLVIASPEPTAITDAYALIKCASCTETRAALWSDSGAGSRNAAFRLVINQAADSHEAARVYSRIRAVCSRFLGVEVALAGWVAQDVRVPEAVRARQLFSLRTPGAEASRNLSDLAASLAQDIGPPPGALTEQRRFKSVASVLRRMLGLD